MRLLILILGVLCIALALVPSRTIPAALQSADAFEALETGTLLFRVCLAVLGLYLVAITRFVRRGEPTYGMLNHDEAPGLAAVILAGIVLVAAALRFVALGNGIWFDEMLMHVNYMSLSPLRILTTFDDANNHVLYSFLARLSIEAFGDTVAAIRLPAVLFGLACIVAIYVYARRVMTWQEALLAAALVAVSYHHVWFSQNARGYTALLFFSLVSSTFLIDALRTGQAWRYLAYALTAALGAYTHLTIGFLFIGHAVYVLGYALYRPGERGTMATLGGAIFFGLVPLGLLILTLYAIVLPDILGGALLSTGLQEDSEWTSPIWALREFVSSFRVGAAGLVVMLGGATVVLAGAIGLARTNLSPVVFLFVPCGLAVIFMTSIGYTLFPRFFFFAMGFGVVIAIRGAVFIGRIFARLVTGEGAVREALGLAPAALMILLSIATLLHVHAPKQDYAGAAAFIEAQRAPEDTVVAIGVTELPFNDYMKKGWVEALTVADIAPLLDGPGRVWTVHTFPVVFPATHPDIAPLLETRFEEAEVFYGTLGGGAIVVSRSMEGDG